MLAGALWPHRLAIALSAMYFVAFGVFSLAWSADGDDLLIFHAAGEAARQGINPYTPGRFSDPFAYPPAWIPFCILISLMPAIVALWVWKILNVLFLVGSVFLSLDLVFADGAPSQIQRTAAWCFALLLWPTSIAVFDGNTPLCVLFFVLLGMWFAARGRNVSVGACLGFSLIKPNIVLPIFADFLRKAHWKILGSALLTLLLLTWLGMYLSGTGVGDFRAALSVYGTANPVTDSSTVGFAKILAILFGMDSMRARLTSGVIGMVVLLLFWLYTMRHDWNGRAWTAATSVYLLLGIGFFGARGYDLVFVIPVFIWLSSLKHARLLAWPALFLALSLVVPQRAVEIFYERVLAMFLPKAFFEMLLSPFRSWIVLALLFLLILLHWRSVRVRTGGLG